MRVDVRISQASFTHTQKSPKAWLHEGGSLGLMLITSGKAPQLTTTATLCPNFNITVIQTNEKEDGVEG